MPQLYKTLTFVLAFTGCVSLVISGGILLLMALPGIGLFPGYYRFLKDMPQAPKWSIGAFSIITLIVFLTDALIISNDSFLAVAHLTIAFQAIKSFDLREPWDHLQVYFMSLLQLIIASELTYSLAYGAIFVFFLIAFVNAIIFAHFMKEGITVKAGLRKPMAYISLLTLVVTALFFVSLPRVHGGLWGKSYATSIKAVGFSDNIDFGSFGSAKLDPTVIMRIELSGEQPGAYYWRGMSLDYFDGVSWKDTFRGRSIVSKNGDLFPLRPFQVKDAVVQKIFLEPMDTDVLFGLGEIAAVEAETRLLFTDTAKSLFLPAKKKKRFQYVVYSVRKETDVNGDVNEYLQVPLGVGKVSQFTREITGRTVDEIDKAFEIERYLKTNYTYSLSSRRPPAGMSPVDDFLFKSKRGYCEHYASAMVLMLRTIGIPARIVTGFYGGEFNEYGGYVIVRQSNAHAWVEAVIDGRWRLFDPTPPIVEKGASAIGYFLDMMRMKWNRYVVLFSSSDQRDIIRTLSTPFRLPSLPAMRFQRTDGFIYAVVFIVTGLAVFFLLKKIRFRHYGFVTGRYMQLKNRIKKRGAHISSSSTPSEVMREGMRLGTDKRIREFITLYEEHRFSGRVMDGEKRARYKKLLQEIVKAAKS
jgi:protein-glutamine gamma-glutamyltransferase